MVTTIQITPVPPDDRGVWAVLPGEERRAIQPLGRDGGRGGMIGPAAVIAVQRRNQQFHPAGAAEVRLQGGPGAGHGVAPEVQAAALMGLRDARAARPESRTPRESKKSGVVGAVASGLMTGFAAAHIWALFCSQSSAPAPPALFRTEKQDCQNRWSDALIVLPSAGVRQAESVRGASC